MSHQPTRGLLALKHIRFIIVAICNIVLITACVSTPEQNLEPISLKLNWTHSVQFIGFYIAQDQGFYEQEGLIVNIEPTTDLTEFPGVINRVAEGDFDFSLTINRSIIDAQANDIPVTAISSFVQRTPNVFFARQDAGIVTIADFENRSIAIKNEVWKTILSNLLSTVDLTLDDVLAVEADFDMQPFYDGEIEIWAGFLTNEPIRARLNDIEIVTFPVHEYVDQQDTISIFTRQELLQDNPDLAVRFLRATLAGWEWAFDNPGEAIDSLIERFPDFEAERDFHLASLIAFLPLMEPVGIELGSIDCEQWLEHEAFEDLTLDHNTLCSTHIFGQATS